MRGHIVLLHGLGRSPWSLRWAEHRLRGAGYTVTNIGYPSRHEPLERLAEHVAQRLPTDPSQPLHFFTHSMGGIVLRCLARSRRPPNLGRAVMLGPPNQGSQVAARLRDQRIFRVMGPAARELGAESDGVPQQLGPVDFEVGVIAGRSRLDPMHVMVAGESDGRVSLEETKVQGMADWIAVNRGHGLLMFDPDVIRQAIHFFEHGRFAR